MQEAQLLVLSRHKSGQGSEFESWYDERHLSDVVDVPGVVSASRFRTMSQISAGSKFPQWSSVALYIIVSDDPQKVIEEIRRRAGQPSMIIDDSLDQEDLVQIVMQAASHKP